MSIIKPGIAAIALIALMISMPASAAEPMSGADIKSTVIGKRIYLSTPFGGAIPMNYFPNGRVDASGDAVGLGRVARPRDSGKWWIDGDRLCQQWTSWYDGKVFCFTLERLDETRLAWARDDGLTGKARIGGAL